MPATTRSITIDIDSNAYGPLGMTGLATSVVGAAVFLRYSLADFLRWWLLRQSYELQAAAEAQRSSTTS
jgi:hypothetical protein